MKGLFSKSIRTQKVCAEKKNFTKFAHILLRSRRPIKKPTRICKNTTNFHFWTAYYTTVEPHLCDTRFDRSFLFTEKYPDALEWPTLPRERSHGPCRLPASFACMPLLPAASSDRRCCCCSRYCTSHVLLLLHVVWWCCCCQ